MSQNSHPYFIEHTFDKSYRAVTRSYKLKPNEKALINYIITWQEKTDKDGNACMCYESNSTISENLGIPFGTFEGLIRNMNKKYDFFASTGIPGKGKSRNGGNFNSTTKIVDMGLLATFLEEEQKEIEANGGERVTSRNKPDQDVVQQPIPIMTKYEVFSDRTPEDEFLNNMTTTNPPQLKSDESRPVLEVPVTHLEAQEDRELVEGYINTALSRNNWPAPYKRTWVTTMVKDKAKADGFHGTPRYDSMLELVNNFNFTRPLQVA